MQNENWRSASPDFSFRIFHHLCWPLSGPLFFRPMPGIPTPFFIVAAIHDPQKQPNLQNSKHAFEWYKHKQIICTFSPSVPSVSCIPGRTRFLMVRGPKSVFTWLYATATAAHGEVPSGDENRKKRPNLKNINPGWSKLSLARNKPTVQKTWLGLIHQWCGLDILIGSLISD